MWTSDAVKLNRFIKAKKKKEKKEGRNYDSAEDDGSFSGEDYDDDEDDGGFFAGAMTEEKSARKQARKMERCEDDAMSNTLYQAQNPLFSNYFSSKK